MGKIFKRMAMQKRDQIEFTTQGFLRVPVFAGRTGIQIYFDQNGNEIRELRPPEEVFREETMKSLTLIPITDDHPQKMVDQNNARVLMVGTTGEHVERIELDDGLEALKTTAVIFDKAAIDNVRTGKQEVSLGYDVELDETPGVFNGEPYDVVQRNIVHNHLALVDKGRAGSEIRLRLDSQTAIVKDNRITIIKEDSTMKVSIGDKEFELNDDVGAAIQGVLDENTELKKKGDGGHLKEEEEEKKKADQEKEKEEKEKADLKAKEEEDQKNETEKEKNDRLQAKNDALAADNAKLKDGNVSESRVDEMVRGRTKALSIGAKVLKADEVEKMDSMSTSALKIAIVEAESGSKMDGKSAAYVDARFDHIAETVNNSDTANEQLSDSLSKRRLEDGKKVDASQARADRMKKDSERWKQPLGKTAQSFQK